MTNAGVLGAAGVVLLMLSMPLLAASELPPYSAGERQAAWVVAAVGAMCLIGAAWWAAS
jgi:hypothetical protein